MRSRRMPYSRVSNLSAGRIALGYAVIATLWIAFSDAIVTHFNLHPFVMTIKGTVFVFVTASLLYFTIRRLLRAVLQTSQERDETTQLYRTVVEASHEGICLLDESGRISFLNARLAAMLGRPAEGLQGKRLQDFIEEPHVLAQPWAQQSETRECRLRKDSDPKPWVLISRHPVLNDAGDVVRMLVTVIDITERKRAEKALHRSDAYLAAVPGSQENLTESQLASPARYGLAILSVGAALGASLLLEHFHFRVPSALLLLFAVAISSWYGGRGPGVLAAIMSMISFYWYFVEPVRTIYIYSSEVPYFIVFTAFAALLFWFATVRRRFEVGLYEQAALLNLTHDTVFVMDLEGVIRYWNRGAEEQYGWPAEKAVGKVVHDLLKTVFPRPLEEIKAELIRTDRWEAELVHTKKGGTQVAVASRWSLQRDRHGAPFAILETNNDISERKRAEEALSRLNRELRAISNCNQVLLRATDEQSLLEEICRIVCEEAGYSTAWVGYAEQDEAKSVRPAAWAGCEGRDLANLGITWADTEHGHGPSGTAIRSGKTCCISDYATDPQAEPWREIALRHGFRSAIALPLKDELTNAFGSLTIFSAQPNAFTSQEIRLLEELAGDLAFGVVTLRSRAARKQAEQQVALLNFAVDSVREAAFLIDDEGCFHYVNEEACRVLGYTRAELLGMAIPDIDPGVPAGSWPEHWRERKTHGSLIFESHHRTRDGRIFPVEISANYFEFGGRAYTLALARDITERKRAEESLRRSEAYLAESERINHSGTWVWNPASGIQYWSKECYGIMGFDPAEGVPRLERFLEAVHPEDRPRLRERLQKVASEKTSYETEYRIMRLSGEVRDLRVIGHPVFDNAGNLLQYVGTTADITERKRAEEEVRNAAAQWQATFDAVQDLVLLLDKDFRILRANHAAAEFLGLRSDEIVGGHCYDLIHGTSTPAAECPLAKMRQSRRHEEAEVLARKGGPWLSVSVDPLFDPSGELTQVVHVARNITERKRAEEARRRSEEYLAEAQRLSHTGSWALDLVSDKYVYVSEEDARIWGFDPREDLPTREAIFQRIHPEDRNRWKAKFEKSLREKADSFDEYRIVLPDGTVKHIHIIRHPVLNEAGDVVQLVGTAMDVTERKLAEEALRRSETYLKEAQRLSHTGSWAFDVAGNEYIYSSEECFRIYGWDPQQGLPTGEAVFQRIHPEDRKRWNENFEKSLRDKVDTFDEYRIVLPEGTMKHIHTIRHPVLNDAGDVVELVGTSIDITDRKRAEEALRDSEQKYLELVEHANSIIMHWQRDGRIIHLNEFGQRLFGYTESEIRGRHVIGTIVPETDSNGRDLRALMDEICAHPSAFEQNVNENVRRNGERVWIAWTNKVVLNSKGEVAEILSIGADITDRKRAEQALRRSEAYLAEGQRLTHAGSWAWSPKTLQSLYWSEEMFRIFALDPQQGVPTSEVFWERVHPEDRDHTYEFLLNAAHRASEYAHDHRILLPDGTVKHIHAIGLPVLDEAGELVEYVGIAMDVTERKRAEEALRESETRFRAFVDHAGDAFFVYDLEQRVVVDVNREACESLGCTRQELVGKAPLAFHLDSYQAEIESIAERAAAGESVCDTHWHRRRDGTVFPVEVHTSLVSYAGRRFLLMVARDISDRLRAEEQRDRLRQLEADLAHINRVSMMGELTASIAHEVNQPLSGVVSNGSACLRWLAGDAPNLDEAREAARRIVRDGKRAGEVIARIRALTRRTEVPREKLNLNETVREVLALIGDDAKRKSVTIRTQFADNVFPVSGDRVQLQQVLLNLAMNGIEAMSGVDERARELVITTRNIDPDQVQVTVEDSGIGLDPDTAGKIFDPFYTTKSGGMGMGLSISRSILQAHGGRLWATVRDGAGTIFYFALPKYHEEPDATPTGA